jgi:tRNA(fMet)-specific endonuclease VapC
VKKILLDTNAYSLFMRQESQDALSIVNLADEVGIPNVVIGELYAGFYGGNRFQENVVELEKFLSLPNTRVIGFSARTLTLFGEYHFKLRSMGLKVPHNDLWIAVLAIEHDFVVYSDDKHLKLIPFCKTIWTLDQFLAI